MAAELLRAHGWDVVHVREIGMRDATDRQTLARAVTDGRICATLDKDFHEALAKSEATRPSVILLRWQNLRWEAVADAIIIRVTSYGKELSSGAAITGSERATRVRNLPLGPMRVAGI